MNTPTEFCNAFIKRELKDYKESKICMSYWPVMERIINRSLELQTVYKEIVNNYDYTDKYSGSEVWLILEHIWLSSDFAKKEVEKARADLKELNQLREEIVILASRLSAALSKQKEIFECSGFTKSDYQNVLDMVDEGGEHNYLYRSYVSKDIQSLGYEYDLKYWPTREDVVQSIADFEGRQPVPTHLEYPNAVLKGRSTDIKDFVIAFDAAFDKQNDLPTGFRFSNNAMAEIINVILDFPCEKLTSGEAVRVVRNRHQKKISSSSF